jgi:hypothetical protein
MSIKQALLSATALCAATILSGCNEAATDPRTQLGANPELPAQTQYWLPPMHIPSVVGWKNGEKPTVPGGMKIDAIATGKAKEK